MLITTRRFPGCVLMLGALLSTTNTVSASLRIRQSDQDTIPNAHDQWTAFANALMYGEGRRGRLPTPEERTLAQEPTPPVSLRSCGQVIGRTTRNESLALAYGLVDTFFAEGSSLGSFNAFVKQILNETILYDFEASVICGSCDELRQSHSSADFLNDDGSNGFLSYCGSGVYGSNVTHSALLFTPLDPDTGEVLQKKLMGGVFMHSTTFDQRDIASELWPANLTEYLTSSNNATLVLAALYDGLAAVIAVTSGAVAILPDYIGYGQSVQYPRSYGVKNLYQQAAVVTWLTAQDSITANTTGCTVLDNVVTVAGYSEGGYAAFAAGLAFDQLGVTVHGVQAGGAPFNVPRQITWVVDRFDTGAAATTPFLGPEMAFFASAYSSTDPDLQNTNTGQDLLADEWMNPNNYTMNTIAWFANQLTKSDILTLVPTNALQLIRPSILEMERNANANNLTDACSLAESNVTDKFCEAVQASDLSQEIQATTFPVEICHSPDDDIVPFLNAPNISANENLSNFSLAGVITATGGHLMSAFPCLFSMLVPFTTANTGESSASSVADLDNPELCVTRSPSTPVTSAPTDAPAPSAPAPTSAGFRMELPMFSLILASIIVIAM